ncbi:MAG: filamentous hemagglutinin N-terminal domain-containing protein [Rivularia sp. (in: cyanobacteria)]
MKASIFQFGFLNGSIILPFLLASIPAGAQIIPDNTLPNNSVVQPGEENTTLIQQGTQRDGNLFHSFQEFSIESGDTARFEHGSDITNIFTRVTGAASNIEGTIQTLINGTTNDRGSANLFIINPNGITFGENANLDIGGSFIGSTADSVKFANETEFSVTNPQSSPLLTIGVPLGLQFGPNPGAIVNRSGNGGFTVPEGKTLGLVGGNLSLEGGGLTATEGRIELGSVAGDSFVSLNQPDYALGYTGVQNFGDITIQNASFISSAAIQVRGKDIILTGSQIFAQTQPSTPGKDLVINASDSLNLSAGALIANFALGEAQGGNAIAQASSINLSEGAIIATSASNQAQGGNAIVEATSLNLSEGAQIATFASGEAQGGNAIAQATSLNLTGVNTQIATSASEQGEAGDVMVMETSEVKLSEGALIRTSVFDEAEAGDVIVKADSIELIGTFSDGMQLSPSAFSTEATSTRDSGNITVETRQLSIKDGANITASTGNEGNAGNIEIKGSDIQLEGTATNGEDPSGIFAAVREGVENPGNAGTITIETNGLTLKAGAQINSVARGDSEAGSVNINASDFITFTGISPTTTLEEGGSGIFATAEDEGNATSGEINLTTPLLTVEEGGRISATNTITNGEGSGNLTLNVDNLVIRDGGTVETRTFGTATGGDLTINAKDSVEVSGIGQFDNSAGSFERNSNISVSSEGSGRGGNLEITALRIKLDNQGEIISESQANADAGNITLKNLNESLFLRRGSRISSTAGTENAPGNGGNISIESPDGFIFAVPLENSDITANAFTGTGGRVDIEASGIYGIEFREQESNPRENQTNDITASSQFGNDGTVELDTPEVDPESGLVELPTIPVDTEVAQGCNSPNTAQSSFEIAGRGGLPPNPQDVLTPGTAQIDWVSVKPGNNNPSVAPLTNKQTTRRNKRIVEATGAILNAKGQIVLTANPSTVTSDNTSRQNLISCQNK